MKHNHDGTEHSTTTVKNPCQLAGGKPVGYLQVQLRSCTRDYYEQIQLVVRACLERENSGSDEGKRPNHWVALPTRIMYQVRVYL